MDVEDPLDVYEFPTNDIKEFIKRCENLEFLVLGDAAGNGDTIARFSCATEYCEHLSQLYFAGKEDYNYICRWNEIVMPEEYPYDHVGDIILDFQTLRPLKVERLRQYAEEEWKLL
jgi:hypothetical protein